MTQFTAAVNESSNKNLKYLFIVINTIDFFFYKTFYDALRTLFSAYNTEGENKVTEKTFYQYKSIFVMRSITCYNFFFFLKTWEKFHRETF